MPRFRLKCSIGLILSLMLIPQDLGFAHTIKAAEDVAALFHLEPDHNPRVDQPAQIWFGLTLKGGAALPLDQCDCQLAIYPEPRSENAEPLLQPELIPVDAERYRHAPGAEVIFPEIGSYELELTGSPQGQASFKPFRLTYSVTVIR